MMETDARFALDSKLHKQFYLRPVMQATASQLADRPIYVDVEFVRILTPGDKLSIIDRIASDDDKRRFADEYAKFKAGRGEEVVGTRLEAVPWMTRSKVEEYKYFGIHTVEQLAAANDNVGQKFPGFNMDREKCQKFIEATSGTDARVTALEAELASMRALFAKQEEAKAILAAPAPTPKAAVKG
jgi:hypothetical protein